MSDGGGESGKELKHYFTTKKKPGNDEFAQAIARIAVAQVCESVGFQGFQQSALDTFSDIACRYIKDIGKTANMYANLAGRTESTVFDIIQGLEDLGSAQGFSAASDINRSLSSLGIIQEVSQYVGLAEEIAFAYSIPHFPVIKEREPRQSFAQAGEIPPSEPIPPWLPRFPNPESCTGLHSFSVKEAEQQHKAVEPSVVSLRQRLACNGSELPVAVDNGDADGKDRAVDINPFLAVPFQFGEKEVASVGRPPKFSGEGTEQNYRIGASPGLALESNPGSTLEEFGPAIEVMNNGMMGSEEGSRKFIKNSRPAVRFKFAIGEKLMDTSIREREKGIKGAISWFENDEVKDVKRKRAEEILRESMVNGKPTDGDSFVN